MNKRITQVEETFSIYCTKMHMIVHTFSDDEWDEEIVNFVTDSPESRFGWTLPFFEGESPSGVSVAYSPERIVRQSSHLDDEMFSEYIDAIEYVINLHTTLFDDFPEEERRSIVDNQLYDRGPGSMQLISDVQLKALDELA